MTARSEKRSSQTERQKQLRKARIDVLQSLFAEEYLPDRKNGHAPSMYDRPLPDRSGGLRDRLWNGILEHRSRIDEVIRSLSPQWSLERMSRVDRNILRIGTYEILYEEAIPFKVSIDESLELAHQFSDPEAVSFINGILHQVGVRLVPEKVAEPAPTALVTDLATRDANDEAG